MRLDVIQLERVRVFGKVYDFEQIARFQTLYDLFEGTFRLFEHVVSVHRFRVVEQEHEDFLVWLKVCNVDHLSILQGALLLEIGDQRNLTGYLIRMLVACLTQSQRFPDLVDADSYLDLFLRVFASNDEMGLFIPLLRIEDILAGCFLYQFPADR